MSIGFLTLDIIIILVLFIGTFIYSYNGGKKQIVKLLLSVYPALLIFLNLNFLDNKDDLVIIGTFIGLYLASFFLLKRNFTAPSSHTGGKKFLDGVLLSVASVFTLLIIYYKILPISSLYELKLPFSGFLIDKIPFYLTVAIPLFILFITNRRDD